LRCRGAATESVVIHARPSIEGVKINEDVMKALLLYVVIVIIGGLISVGIGYYVEKEVSSAASLIVFLALFFSNFAVSWLAVILIMDGSFKMRRVHRAVGH
jgi:hypothetical protein